MFLEIKNLSKKYQEKKVVKNINFSLQKGTALGLLGPNGAGKSTTIAMIATLLKPNSGQILLSGQDIYQKPKPLQAILGYVPQEIALFEDLTALDNLKFFGKAYNLKKKELNDRIECVAEQIGLKNKLKEKVYTFSGGMKRRLNIGAALLHQPQLLILDEPTVGIDPQSRNHILELVKNFHKEGMSIIYTSHYMNEIETICEKILIMEEGEIVAQGSKNELLNTYKGNNLEEIFLEITGRELRD